MNPTDTKLVALTTEVDNLKKENLALAPSSTSNQSANPNPRAKGNGGGSDTGARSSHPAGPTEIVANSLKK